MPTLHRRDARIGPPAARPKKYKPDAIRSLFSVWLRGTEGPDGEQRAFCPLCEDPDASKTPSASFNVEEGVWSCQKSNHGGSIYDLVETMKREHGWNVKPTAERSRARASASRPRKSKLPPEIDHTDKATVDWPSMLHSERYKTRLAYLTTERGLTLDTIKTYGIGYDGQRYTVPIRSADGVIRNVRKYLHVKNSHKRSAEQQKWLHTAGHGAPAMVAFTSELAQNSHAVIFCAGEFDAMLTNQRMEGFPVVAVTATGGEGKVPPYLDDLLSREVFVAYDCDQAGVAGADKLAGALSDRGANVYTLDLTNLGLPFGNGADLTDYWMKYGGTPEALLDLMQQARSAPTETTDEILAAMEAGFLELGSPRDDYTPLLLSEDDVLSLAPLQYSIDTFVPRGMFTSLYGPPGSKKTFIAQDMGNCIRAGIPWHGHPVSPGAVLMLEAEGVEQLQGRILAWKEHHDDPPMLPFRVLEEPMDLSSPEGAAALVRTVRGMEAQVGERVELIIVDPAALYMSGSENEDGNRNLAIGLNAVAKYLGVGLVVIMHTNASGERARGTDHFRMLAGSHIRVEVADDGNTGVTQEKVKNSEPRAVLLRPVPVLASLAFETVERMSASAYSSRRASSEWTSKASLKLSEARVARQHKVSEAEGWIVEKVAEQPGISKTQLLSALRGRQVGSDGLDAARLHLISTGVIRVEDGPRGAVLHYPVEGSEVAS